MGRKRNFTITEDLKELEKLKKEVMGFKTSQRLGCLILIKSEKYKTLGAVADHLDINVSTLQRWLLIYRDNGIDDLLRPETRRKPSKIITPGIHKQLEEKLRDSKNPFSGYVEVQQWLKKEHHVEIEYQWLWKYMKEKLGAVLKTPRKSNVKKQQGTADSFFKTTLHAQTD